jgi:biotin carboxyl carrier protein
VPRHTDPDRAPDVIGTLLGRLGTKTGEQALNQLTAIGLPAIERLVEGRAQGRPVLVPANADPRCFIDDVSSLIYRVALGHPGEFVDYALAKRHEPAARELIGALGATGDGRALPMLIDASRDRDPSLRNSAVRAMARLADSRASSALLDRIRDRDELVALGALQALAACGDAQALPVVEKLAKSGPAARRGAATGAADAIRRRLGLEPLPSQGGRTFRVSLDESHRSKKQRVGRCFRVYVKPGDRVAADQPLAAVVSKEGEFPIEAPCAGEVVEVEETPDRVTVAVRERVAADARAIRAPTSRRATVPERSVSVVSRKARARDRVGRSRPRRRSS